MRMKLIFLVALVCLIVLALHGYLDAADPITWHDGHE